MNCYLHPLTGPGGDLAQRMVPLEHTGVARTDQREGDSLDFNLLPYFYNSPLESQSSENLGSLLTLYLDLTPRFSLILQVVEKNI